MDGVHFPQSKPWVSADVVEFDRYFFKFMEAREEFNDAEKYYGEAIPEWLKDEEGKTVTKKLVEYMDVDQLRPNPYIPVPRYTVEEINDSAVLIQNSNIPTEGKAAELKTLQLRKSRDDEETTMNTRYLGDLHLTTVDYVLESQLLEMENKPPLNESELIFSIYVYEPLQKYGTRSRTPCLLCKLHVLGSQTLRDVQTAIKCAQDLEVTEDMSENPKGPMAKTAREKENSACFYINGTFYVDERREAGVKWQDLSAPYIKWASNPMLGVGPFSRASMEGVTLSSLKVRLGYPYLYMHLDVCEHLLIMADVWLHNPTVQPIAHSAAYPLTVRRLNQYSLYCMICEKVFARWITWGNTRLPDDPFVFCNTCFFAFNYDAEGKKVGKFTAFPYFDVHAHTF